MCVESLYWEVCWWSWESVGGESLVSSIFFNFFPFYSSFFFPSSSLDFVHHHHHHHASCLSPCPSSHPSPIWLVFTGPYSSNVTFTHVPHKPSLGSHSILSITLSWHLAPTLPIQLVKWLTPHLTQKQMLYVRFFLYIKHIKCLEYCLKALKLNNR